MRLTHMWERGSSVLSDFSCHMEQGRSPIWELESDCIMHNYACMMKNDHILNQITSRKKVFSQLILGFLKRLLQPYWTFVNHTVQHSKSSGNLSPGYKMQLWHSLCCRPCPMWQEMSLWAPAFRRVQEQDYLGLTILPLKIIFMFCNYAHLSVHHIQETILDLDWGLGIQGTRNWGPNGVALSSCVNVLRKFKLMAVLLRVIGAALLPSALAWGFEWGIYSRNVCAYMCHARNVNLHSNSWAGYWIPAYTTMLSHTECFLVTEDEEDSAVALHNVCICGAKCINKCWTQPGWWLWEKQISHPTIEAKRTTEE